LLESEISVRRAIRSDLERIVQIHETELAVGALAQLSHALRRRFFREIIDNPSSDSWVAEKCDGSVEGICFVLHEGFRHSRCTQVRLLTQLIGLVLCRPEFRPLLRHELLNRFSPKPSSCCEISHFAVSSNHQSQKIGSLLLSKVFNEAREAGLLGVITTSHNTRLLAHYKRRYAARVIGYADLEIYRIETLYLPIS